MFSTCAFETQNIDVEQINENQQKSKIRKRDFKEKTRQETKKDAGLMKTNFAIEYFDVVLFHETKAREDRKRKREKEGTKRKKKKDKKEERKKITRERERDRERQRETERDRERQRETERDRERQRET